MGDAEGAAAGNAGLEVGDAVGDAEGDAVGDGALDVGELQGRASQASIAYRYAGKKQFCFKQER